MYIEQGAQIVGAFPSATEGYDLAEPNEHTQFQDFGHSHWKNSLIWGIGLEDITISGPGLIYGKGLTREESRLPGVGNKAISLKLCKNVTLKDFSLLHCGHFGLLATGVDNLSILNVKVDTNRDGFDIDCCKNVRIRFFRGIKDTITLFADKTDKEVKEIRKRAAEVAEQALWKHFIQYYYEAYDIALRKARIRQLS